MTRAIPFTAASLARAIKGVEQAGEKVIGVRPDGKLILESGNNGVESAAIAKEFVYFISDGEFVKIGYSLDWRSRLKQLQASNPRDLSALAIFEGTQADEYALHQRFAAHRVRPTNEWFHRCMEITTYLARRRLECVKDAKNSLLEGE